MRLLFAVALATLSGFIALSYEIVWIRAYSFVSWGRAPAFGVLLGTYLAGLAGGSILARRYCGAAEERRALNWLGFYFLAANLLGYILLPLMGEAVRHRVPYGDHGVPYYWTLPLFALVAALLGTGLPLISHFGIPPDVRAGARLSYLYVGNILGSAAGSMLTGFVLMDHWSLRGISVFLALAGLALSAGVLAFSARRRGIALGVAALSAILVVFAAPSLFGGIYEKLQLKVEYVAGYRFREIIETRSGVITVNHLGQVYGGGAYDGMFHTDPVSDANGILRAYALAAVHPGPRDVLLIGLGSGSWAQVVANHPTVERLTVVEINSGYLQLIKTSPVVRGLLENPKVEFVIDDGRRWLQRHDAKFDAIVQNTTYHWRSHTTNLLSREYMELCRAHLKPGGVMLYNTTSSDMAQKTGATVFPYAWRFRNFLYVSVDPFVPDTKRWAETLAEWKIDGRPVLPADSRADLTEEWEDRASILKRTAPAPLITDDNMASEWRH